MRTMRHLLEALLVYAAYGFFRILPLAWASAVGGALGRYVGIYLPHTRIARQNLSLAMPELDEVARQRIIKGMWENMGRVMAEFPHIARLSEEAFRRICTVEGLEHIETLQKKGGIFISGHLANWEMAPKTAAMYHMPVALIYRHANNPWVDRLIVKNRSYYQAVAFPKGQQGARGMLKVLKEKGVAGMLVDQKMNDGMAVPFFGQDAMTAPAVATLALKTGCPVVPVQVVRTGGARFKVIVHPPLKVKKTGDKQQDSYAMLCQINILLEQWVREHPEQWLWVHRRWPKERD